MTKDDDNGSCTVGPLLAVFQAQSRWESITSADIKQVVRNSDKQRFLIEKGRIRARYGRSQLKVEYTLSHLPRGSVSWYEQDGITIDLERRIKFDEPAVCPFVGGNSIGNYGREP